MKAHRSASFALTASLGVLLAVAIAMANGECNQQASLAMPAFHSAVEGQTFPLKPISERKAPPIRDFKLGQI